MTIIGLTGGGPTGTNGTKLPWRTLRHREPEMVMALQDAVTVGDGVFRCLVLFWLHSIQHLGGRVWPRLEITMPLRAMPAP